MKIHIRSI